MPHWARTLARMALGSGSNGGVCGAVVAALVVVALSGQPSTAQMSVPSSVYTRPQHLVAIDGARKLNLYCVGSGVPTVVLDGAAGNSMATWRLVQAEIAKVTNVCAYDRAGLGFSDASGRPSDVRNMVDDLHRLVKAAGIPTPFVYVGHSLAGMLGVLYAASYPDDIAGAVMVDPSFAGQIEAVQAEMPPDKRNSVVEALDRQIAGVRMCLGLAQEGELAHPATPAARSCVDTSQDPNAPDNELRDTIAHLKTLPRLWEAQASELASFTPHNGQPGVDSAELEAVKPSFGDKPIAVLTAGGKEAGTGAQPAYLDRVKAAWRAGHDRIAALSSRGENTIIPGANHYIQIDRPEVVIDAIRRVVAVVRLK